VCVQEPCVYLLSAASVLIRNSRNQEKMEHLLYRCGHYSQPLWERTEEILAKYLGFQLIILKVLHSSILLHVRDKHTRMMLIMIAHETKRDIIYSGRKPICVPVGFTCSLSKAVLKFLWPTFLKFWGDYVKLCNFNIFKTFFEIY
jgi:hypothetical protein